MKTFFENLEALSKTFGTSGDESRVRRAVYEEIISYPGCIVKTDNAGNLIVTKKGAGQPKNRLMLSAHMDEAGFIITHIDENGFLKFSPIGSVDGRVTIGKRVIVGEKALPGLIGSKAIHLVKEDEFKSPVKTDSLYIDIGAESREEAEMLVSIGERAVFDSDFCEFGDGCVCGRALDSRAGCAVLMEVLKSEAEFDFTVCFTTREEIRGNGAFAAAFGVDPDISLVADTVPAGDIPCVPEDKFICKQGAGPVIPFRDSGTLYDLDLYRYITELCEKENIPAQTKHGVCGENGAAAIHSSRGGIRTAAVLVPVRYARSPYVSLKLSDAENAVALINLLIKGLCEI